MPETWRIFFSGNGRDHQANYVAVAWSDSSLQWKKALWETRSIEPGELGSREVRGGEGLHGRYTAKRPG